jgi:hypothetical protein
MPLTVKEVVPDVIVLVVGIDKEVVLTPAFRPKLIWENAGNESRITNTIAINFFMVTNFKFINSTS